jgi:hypothetical protein
VVSGMVILSAWMAASLSMSALAFFSIEVVHTWHGRERKKARESEELTCE